MYTYLATAIVSGALFFIGGYQLEKYRWNSHEKTVLEQRINDERELARNNRRMVQNVVDAANASRVRETKLRADADSSRGELGGLRDASTRALQDARTSLDTCTQRATSFSKLLAQCGAAYQELGERADRHVSDIQTLISAWPK